MYFGGKGPRSLGNKHTDWTGQIPLSTTNRATVWFPDDVDRRAEVGAGARAVFCLRGPKVVTTALTRIEMPSFQVYAMRLQYKT